jgi:hypothetical protein
VRVLSRFAEKLGEFRSKSGELSRMNQISQGFPEVLTEIAIIHENLGKFLANLDLKIMKITTKFVII